MSVLLACTYVRCVSAYRPRSQRRGSQPRKLHLLVFSVLFLFCFLFRFVFRDSSSLRSHGCPETQHVEQTLNSQSSTASACRALELKTLPRYLELGINDSGVTPPCAHWEHLGRVLLITEPSRQPPHFVFETVFHWTWNSPTGKADWPASPKHWSYRNAPPQAALTWVLGFILSSSRSCGKYITYHLCHFSRLPNLKSTTRMGIIVRIKAIGLTVGVTFQLCYRQSALILGDISLITTSMKISETVL